MPIEESKTPSTLVTTDRKGCSKTPFRNAPWDGWRGVTLENLDFKFKIFTWSSERCLLKNDHDDARCDAATTRKKTMNYTSRRRPTRRLLRWNQLCLVGVVLYLLGSLYLHAQFGKRGQHSSRASTSLPPLDNNDNRGHYSSSPILRQQHPHHQQQQQRSTMNTTHNSFINQINPSSNTIFVNDNKHTAVVSSSSLENKGMSACLLVMDDNHFLIEWLAYHYHVLPLRYLVLASDPRSKTSPEPILQRWRQTTTTNLNIVTWHDDDFMNATEIEQAESYVKYHFGADIAPALIRHRARQRLFYYKCMIHLKQQARDWTVLIDSDEFLMISYPTVRARGHEAAPPITQPGSVLTFLQRELKRTDHNLTTPCVQIPRARFGGQESTALELYANNVVPPRSGGFDAMNFLTLRYRHHANVHDYGVNKISKVMVDLSRVDWHDLQPVDSIHRPIKTLCGHRRLHIRQPEQVFVINHYLGSWEQYVYRSDARQGNERSIRVCTT
jgi:hypothetical protein